MLTYWKLNLKRITFEVRNNSYSIVRYASILLIIASFLVIFEVNNGFGLIRLFVNTSFGVILPRDYAFYTIFLAFLASHFSLTLFYPLSIFPFIKFNQKYLWYLKSIFYPLCSPFFIFIIIVSFFYIENLLYYILFIISNILFVNNKRLSYKFLPVFLLGYFFSVELFHYLTLFLFTGVAYLTLDTKIKNREKLPLHSVASYKKIDIPLLYKELNYYKMYKSESYYLFLNTIFSAILFLSVFSSIENITYDFLFWVNLGIAVIPFSLTLFNMLGMDTNLINRLRMRPDLATKYLKRRYRLYINIVYIYDLVIIISFALKFGEVSIIPLYIGASVLFNEIVLLLSSCVSIVFLEKKEVHWRYGQYIFSKSNNLMPVVLLANVLLLSILSSYMHVLGIIALGLIMMIINNYFYKDILKLFLQKYFVFDV